MEFRNRIQRILASKLFLQITMVIAVVVALALLVELVFFTESAGFAIVLVLAIITIMGLAALLLALFKQSKTQTAPPQTGVSKQYDEVTGLATRQFFYTYLDQALAEAKRKQTCLAVMFVDIDQFRNINDRYGYDCGDEVLQAVSKRLQDCLTQDGLVVRFAGDEFIIVLPNINQEQTEQLAENLIDQFQEPMQLDSRKLKLTISAGIAMYPLFSVEKDILLQHAQSALHQAKDEGRNNYQFFIQTLYEARKRDVSIEQELRFAIDNDELKLHYQPIIALEDESVVGLEVLLRWHNKELGNVPPDEFIQVAEASGLISEIDTWVLTTACRQFAEWQDTLGAIKLHLSLNCSTVELQGDKVVPTLKQTIEDTRIDPQRLIIEVTETAVMERADQAIQTLEHLKQMGINIAIDDFGTGYSSFDYLKKLPISLIKIDKSFIQDLEDNPSDREIVQAIIKLANTLNISTTAEGVETQQEMTYLTQFGCTYAQGYYFAKPMDVASTEQYLKQQHEQSS